MKIYYIYELIYDNKSLYVGYGTNDRIDHLLSCVSHNNYLNKFASIGYDKTKISIVKHYENIDKNTAIIKEIEMIKLKTPIFNKFGNPKYKDYIADIYIEEHFNSMIFHQLGKKYDSHPYIKNLIEIINKKDEIINRLEEKVELYEERAKIYLKEYEIITKNIPTIYVLPKNVKKNIDKKVL